MKRRLTGRAFFRQAAIVLALATSGPAQEPRPQWWQRGQDRWYYKDDWKGEFLSGGGVYRKTLDIPEQVRAAYAYVWSSHEYVFKVNDREIGADADAGTIENYDLTGVLVPGANTIEIRSGGETNCEIGAVLTSGREILAATDASWGRKGTRASLERRDGPRGYAGDTHMANIVCVTAEQKAKAAVNRINSARRRILDRDRFLFWRERDPREVLLLGDTTPPRQAWAQIEQLLAAARPAAEHAASLVLAGKFAEAEAAAAPALQQTAAAEKTLKGMMASLGQRTQARAQAINTDRWPEDPLHATFNGSLWNRLGWVASCEPLDSDPSFWEFDLAPPGAGSTALAGWWRFRLDPDDRGVAAGWAMAQSDDSAWNAIYSPSKWGWERFGYIEHHAGCHWNKPYNGLAWYRKQLTIPAGWQGGDLVLRVGDLLHNSVWLAVNGQFVNDPAGKGSEAETIVIPARLLRFGQSNTLVLRVLNMDNIGGLTCPGLRLSQAARPPQVRRHPCGPGSAREQVYQTPDGPVTQVIYSSALSPGVVAATSGRTLCLLGWQARGYAGPRQLTYAKTDGQLAALTVGGTPEAVNGSALGENWLLLEGAQPGPRAARPLLVVFQHRPEKIALSDDGFGGTALCLSMSRPGERVLLVRPFEAGAVAAGRPEQIDRCRLWSAALLRYPIGYLERIEFQGDRCNVQMAYEYAEFPDDWQTAALRLAPLPMLVSYAMEHRWPQVKVEGRLLDLGCRAASGYYPQMDCGTYRALLDAGKICYRFDRMEPKVRYVGVGTMGEEQRIGGAFFDHLRQWGCNSWRPQIGLPPAAAYGDPKEMARFDFMLDAAQRHRMTCFLNWFTSQEVPADRRQDFIDRWAAAARRCKDLPAGLIFYDFINEPAGVRWDEYNRLMKDVAAAVRAIDKVHGLSVESAGGWAQPEDFDMLEPVGDEKTIYQFHTYGPHTFDVHREDLWYPRYAVVRERFESYENFEERMLAVVRFQIRHKAEVMHGEFGVSFLGPDDAPRRWLESVLAIHEKYRIHWNWWNYSGRDIHRTGLVAGGRVNPLTATLREYALRKPPH